MATKAATTATAKTKRKKILVSKRQAMKNREGIKAMWKKIPKAWVDLDVMLCSRGSANEPDEGLFKTTERCTTKDGPKNDCGAVGCFAGWNITYPPYQRWCRRHNLSMIRFENLRIYLGLEKQDQWRLFGLRERLDLTQKQEVKQRINQMMTMPVTAKPSWGQRPSKQDQFE